MIIDNSSLPPSPGIYQFFDADDQVLYVGKAKNLRKRVSSYGKKNLLSARISRMVSLSRRLEFIQTTSELEALLLEHNLIKKLQPKFNILLRDDKTFAQIAISNHAFPRIEKFREQKKFEDNSKTSIASKNREQVCFGPFASGFDVNKTIDVLRKAFRLRNCSDFEFKSRQKPCLEYQIKKCSAPCVGEISQHDYKISVEHAIDFLAGKSAKLQKDLANEMRQASEKMDYEKAAQIRDQIKSLNSIQAKQNINVDEEKDFDAIAFASSNGKACAYISFYRGGQNFGAKPYFFEGAEDKKNDDLLSQFLGQFYLSKPAPSLILLGFDLDEKKLMQNFLEKISGKKTKILTPQKGWKASIINDLTQLAQQNLEQKITQSFNNREIFLELKKVFDLPKIPARIEVYDNSHTSGTNAVGAMIAAGLDGFIKSGYRKFNLFKNPRDESVANEPSNLRQKRDDTAMLTEVLTRRFSKKHDGWPDFIIIDGGKPQLSAAQKVFEQLEIKIPFTCMAKGEDRNAGEEKFFMPNCEEKEPISLPKHSPLLHYLQRLRDEAHRFAIMTHRKKRSKNFLAKN